jgi:hypothetical protein
VSVATVTVPAAYVDELRTSLLCLYGAEAESVYLSVQQHQSGKVPLTPLLGHREELLAVDRLLVRLGWPSPAPARADVELSGDRRLLSAAVFGVLLELCARVDTACARYWRGEAEAAQLRRAAEDVLALLPLAVSLRPHRDDQAQDSTSRGRPEPELAGDPACADPS